MNKITVLQFLQILEKGYHFLIYNNSNELLYSSIMYDNSDGQLNQYKDLTIGSVGLKNTDTSTAFVLSLDK